MEILTLSADSMLARRGIKWHKYPGNVLPAWVADMDYTVAEPIQRAIRRLLDEQDYGYPVRVGRETVATAFADRMRDRFQWRVDPDRVVPVADLVQAVVASLLAFSGAGDGVVVQTPIYPPFLSAIAETGRHRVANPLVDDGTRLALDLEGLRQVVDERTRILLVCNPHNPSGRVLEREELEGLGQLAMERDLVIVSDEIHCDLVYDGRLHIPIGSLSEEIAARTVTLNSATKGFNIPGLRCAVMHFGSEALQERFAAAIPGRLLGAVNVFGTDATVAAWRECQPWLDRVMPQLAANRDRVAAWVLDAAPGIRHREPEATFLAWLDCRDLQLPAASPYDFWLQEARVGLGQGSDFGPGGEACVRLNFATSPEILDRILDRMARALRRTLSAQAT